MVDWANTPLTNNHKENPVNYRQQRSQDLGCLGLLILMALWLGTIAAAVFVIASVVKFVFGL